MVEMLPKGNKCVLDRFVYHLARVAHQESVTKMSASNLAVIFAPCIVCRNTSTIHAQEQLMDVQKQAICVQTLIEDKLRHCQETLFQIIELESASEKVGIYQISIILIKKICHYFRESETDRKAPLAPVASSEDLTDEAEREGGGTGTDVTAAANNGGGICGAAQCRRTKSSSWQRSAVGNSREEYALDLSVPPVIACLSHASKLRAKFPPGTRRSPSALFFRQKLNQFLLKLF